MFLVVLLAAGGLQRATAPPPPLPGGGSSSSSSLAALGVLADLGPPHPPSSGHFATFRLHTVDASSGAVRLVPTTSGAACPVLDGVNCTLPDPYSDAAAGVVVPAAQAPSAHATLFFAFTCLCEVRTSPHTVENIWAAPTLAALDLVTLEARKVCDTPPALFNTQTQDFPTVGWVAAAPGSDDGDGGRLLFSAPSFLHRSSGAQPPPPPLRASSNTTVLYLLVDPVSGAITQKYTGPTRCYTCHDEGAMANMGYGIDANRFSLYIRLFTQVRDAFL
jgi:hypothetical protein